MVVYVCERKVNVTERFKKAKSGEEHLKIIAADSGAAVLNERFEPVHVVAACAVLVEPPYNGATSILAEAIFSKAENGHDLVVHELELCMNFLKTVSADVVHLDMSFGGLSIEELSPISLAQTHLGSRARGHVLKILPRLRKTAMDIKRVYDVDVLAIGKESVPVRIAELTAGAYATLYSAEKALNDKTKVLLGLPARCSIKLGDGKVTAESLLPAEQDIEGHATDDNGILRKVQISEMPNPVARGFRVLDIKPRA